MQRHASPAPKRPNPGRLFLEPLEDRHLLSGVIVGPMLLTAPGYSAQSAAAATVKQQNYSNSAASASNGSYGDYSYQSTDDDGSDAAYTYPSSPSNSPAKNIPAGEGGQQANTPGKTAPQPPTQQNQAASHFVATSTLFSALPTVASPLQVPSGLTQPDAGGTNQLSVLALHPQPLRQAIVLPSAEIAAGLVVDREGLDTPLPASMRFVPELPVPRPEHPGNLIAGTLPLDLAALERGVSLFFAQLDDLGQQAPMWRTASTLTRWVVAAVFANAAYEMACWLGKPSRSADVVRGWRLEGRLRLADPVGDEP
jgi:hypothetical protein